MTYLGDYGYVRHALYLLSLMAFFVLGMHAGYAIYFPELFPTRLRATGASVCFNMGRVLGAVILVIRGELGRHLGMPRAAATISCLFWVGLILLWFTPETRGRELPAGPGRRVARSGRSPTVRWRAPRGRYGCGSLLM